MMTTVTTHPFDNLYHQPRLLTSKKSILHLFGISNARIVGYDVMSATGRIQFNLGRLGWIKDIFFSKSDEILVASGDSLYIYKAFKPNKEPIKHTLPSIPSNNCKIFSCNVKNKNVYFVFDGKQANMTVIESRPKININEYNTAINASHIVKILFDETRSEIILLCIHKVIYLSMTYGEINITRQNLFDEKDTFAFIDVEEKEKPIAITPIVRNGILIFYKEYTKRYSTITGKTNNFKLAKDFRKEFDDCYGRKFFVMDKNGRMFLICRSEMKPIPNQVIVDLEKTNLEEIEHLIFGFCREIENPCNIPLPYSTCTKEQFPELPKYMKKIIKCFFPTNDERIKIG
eukprot:164647_1